jgi:hypothetical protein
MKAHSIVLIVGFALATTAAPVYADLAASATVTESQINPTTFQYDLTLNNLGTTTIGTFWFGWVPGEDFMPVSPSGVSSPTSWNDVVTHGGASDGYAIQWTASSVGAELAAGKSLSGFAFDSTATPAQLAGLSPFYPTMQVETSFVYTGAPFSDPGFEFVAANPVQAVPEPSTFGFAAAGAGLLFLISWRRKRYARS